MESDVSDEKCGFEADFFLDRDIDMTKAVSKAR